MLDNIVNMDAELLHNNLVNDNDCNENNLVNRTNSKKKKRRAATIAAKNFLGKFLIFNFFFFSNFLFRRHDVSDFCWPI